MTAHKKTTPVRVALWGGSCLQPMIRDGIEALERADRKRLADDIRTAFGDSLNLDRALQRTHPQEHRWDYLLGVSASGRVVAIESHAAKQAEISTVISKRKAALQQIRPHLRPGTRVAVWLWVASGRIQFAETEKAVRRLDDNGITFVKARVMAKHLSGSTTRSDRR